MDTSSYIILVILIAVFLCFVGFCYCLIKSIKTNRRNARKDRMQRMYPIACAGSCSKEIGKCSISASPDASRFCDPEGNELNPAEFDQFVVHGNSMSLCGIHDTNLLFVAKDFNLGELTDFPKILVIKRRDAQPNEVEYKIRRAWRKCSVKDELETIIQGIMDSDEFKEILVSDKCPGIEVLRDDFLNVRLKRYYTHYPDARNEDSDFHNVIVSTTWHTDDEKGIRFSIHPVKDIIGIARYSFTIPQRLIK